MRARRNGAGFCAVVVLVGDGGGACDVRGGAGYEGEAGAVCLRSGCRRGVEEWVVHCLGEGDEGGHGGCGADCIR